MLITGNPINNSLTVQEAEVKYNALSTTSPYLDLGAVIDTTNMAAGATVFSNWYDGVEWVRNIFIGVQCDQQYDVYIQYRDTSLTIMGVTAVKTNQTASWGNFPFNPTTNGLCGYSVRFGIKNSSASPNTYARYRTQLMGV